MIPLPLEGQIGGVQVQPLFEAQFVEHIVFHAGERASTKSAVGDIVLFVVILLRSIWMFTKFDTVWLLTQGGGAEKYIRTLPVYAYMRTFMYYQAGLGSALAVIMFIILIVATTIYFKMFRREEEI